MPVILCVIIAAALALIVGVVTRYLTTVSYTHLTLPTKRIV